MMGAPGALRPYNLSKPERRSRTLANPMAAKLGEGAGTYDDQQNWSGWVMDNWQAGVGKKDPQGGGFLYAQAETRFPNRMLLPYMPIQPNSTDANSYNYQAGLLHPNTTILVGANSPIKRISHKFTAQAGGVEALCYLKNEGKVVSAVLYTDLAGKPDAVVGFLYLNTVLTNDYNNIGYSLYKIDLGATTPGTDYHIVVYPTSGTDTITLPAYAPGTSGVNNQFDGATWTAYTTAVTLFGVISFGGSKSMVNFNGRVYAYSGSDVVKLDGSNAWQTLTTLPGTITNLAAVGNVLYIALGSTIAFYTMTTAEVFTVDPGANNADLFVLWKGFLYRSYGRNVYYTGDGTNWTGPISVAETGESIVDMDGVGDFLYVATNLMLYYIGYGDQVLTVTPWPQLGSTPVMLTYQGALYVALGRSLIKYESGSVLPLGLDLGEGLPALRDGNVTAMAQSNYWLFVAVSAKDTQGMSTIWAFNGQGWHFVTALVRHPTASVQDPITNLLYDRSRNTLYIGSSLSGNYMLTLLFPDVANYSTEIAPRYSPFGWLETDWFYGGLFEIYKDMESVYISCELCDANRYIEVYWKDDDSTAWELLGTVTSARQELRWSTPATRPNTRQIKLGFALYSKIANTSPIIRAIRLKFMTMVTDRWRWTLPVEVSDNQQFPDGSINPNNAFKQREHLDAMIKSVPPVILEDVDGVRYEVKVLSASEQVEKWELDQSTGETRIQYTYNLTVEQATTATYSG